MLMDLQWKSISRRKLLLERKPNIDTEYFNEQYEELKKENNALAYAIDVLDKVEKLDVKKILHSLYAYKHAVNGYKYGWGYSNEPNYEEEDIKTLKQFILGEK